MDLREYAISQKIQGKSDLLNYVVNNKDVPVDVLETSFSDLLTEQTDAHVADISNDYIKYLKERVKVGIIPLGDHKFEVSGDISDNELEVIELLTGDDKDTVVKRLLDNVLNELRGHNDLDISEIEFSESEIKEAVKHANDKVEEIINNLPELPVHEKAHEETHEVEEIVERPQMFDDEDDIKDEEVSEDVFDIDVDTIDFGVDLEDEEVSEDDYEDEYPEYDDEYLDEESSEYDEESSEYDEESVEYDEESSEYDEESHEDDDQVDVQTDVPEEVILDIYNSFVGDIRARGLDKKLNLNI